MPLSRSNNRHATNKKIDRIDRNILEELQKNGRLSNVELSKRVGLSPTPCLERVKRLENDGYITGYRAILEPALLDAALLVIVEITLEKTSPDVFDDFSKAVQDVDVIQECHLVSGDFDFLLKTRVKDMAAYRELLGDTLLRLPAVSESRTYVVMEEVKSANVIPVNLVSVGR
ncbi:leucine-responsive transcriptional regulator Lrp [Thalassotalea euphylliae]|uniref:Leucine-responsive regulatory protein n=1 Tax=Thalassotalea euphylliae TaxID=1655234 RepID=A0A3E0TQK8_9GAMM|nr:leucine-responsive transcriptional regulator Lrp [Thalassotalea euphylliae]REL26829.1 leucine-responsive transcriptional regulator Lrp [Thalassotalea euphylliae]